MKRYVIFANGDYDPGAHNHVQENDVLVAVDGGAEYVLKDGFEPDIVIGDFDSLSKSTRGQIPSEKLLKYPVDKNSTDVELAVDYCVDQGSKDVLVLHAAGGRTDQLLGNYLLFTQEKYSHLNVFFITGNQHMTMIHPDHVWKFQGKRGDGFSIVPFSESVLVKYLTGTKWELADTRLFRGSSLSLSNSFESGSISLMTGAGVCLVVHIHL